MANRYKDLEKRALYQGEWKKKNTTQISLNLNHNTDEDILTFLNSLPNKQGYIKALIREDMKKGEQK